MQLEAKKNFAQAIGVGAQSYRPDIDGLRAVAVLSVVLYHLHQSLVPGGFVGVDIFFVISGYLITKNIWKEIREGRFTLRGFYLKRIRRIAPAVLVMTFCVLVAGSLLMQPQDLVKLAYSAIATTFSFANVYFWKFLDISYFAAASDQVPLLHMWSLGVEEQFYLLWPGVILIALALRNRRSFLIALAIAICIASYIYAELTNATAIKFSYYMLPTRAGELMIGALLALGAPGSQANSQSETPRTLRQVLFAEGLAVTGFLLITYSLYGLNSSSPFPGVNAIWPCLGAALLILAGDIRSSCVRLVLTPRIMVYVGLISYSLYLWHWPIFAFIRYFVGEMSFSTSIVALVASLVAAFLSYRYVEQPTRHWRARPRRQVAFLFGVPAVVVSVVTVVVVATGGLIPLVKQTAGYTQGVHRVERWTAPAYDFPFNCQDAHFKTPKLAKARCVIGPIYAGAQAIRPSVLLWGDSRAAQYVGLISQIAKRQHFNFRNATRSGCAPVFMGSYMNSVTPGCNSFNILMKRAIFSGVFHTIIISAGWPAYAVRAEFRNSLDATIRTIAKHGVHVVLIGTNPQFPRYTRKCELRALRIGATGCVMNALEFDTGGYPIDDVLKSFGSELKAVEYLDARHFFCANGICSPYRDHHPMYFDPGHISMQGSILLGQEMESDLKSQKWKDIFSDVAQRARLMAAAQPRVDITQRSHLFSHMKLNFPYLVRSSVLSSEPDTTSAVILEYWQTDRDVVSSALARGLMSLGYEKHVRKEKNNVLVMDFKMTGTSDVTVVLEASAKRYRSGGKGAGGLAYVVW